MSNLKALVEKNGTDLLAWPGSEKDKAILHWLNKMSTATPNEFECKYEELQRIIIGLRDSLDKSIKTCEKGESFTVLSLGFMSYTLNATYQAIEQDLLTEISAIKDTK